jgi:hypothetical protein
VSVARGARVRITGGKKAVGTTGTVFWTGPNKWGEGERLGVEGDDGETWWVASTHVEPTDDAPPEIELPAKGARVRFELDGVEVEGTVFWTGPAKSGRGHRIGVTSPSGDSHWVDARKLLAAPGHGPAWNDDDPAF